MFVFSQFGLVFWCVRCKRETHPLKIIIYPDIRRCDAGAARPTLAQHYAAAEDLKSDQYTHNCCLCCAACMLLLLVSLSLLRHSTDVTNCVCIFCSVPFFLFSKKPPHSSSSCPWGSIEGGDYFWTGMKFTNSKSFHQRQRVCLM